MDLNVSKTSLGAFDAAPAPTPLVLDDTLIESRDSEPASNSRHSRWMTRSQCRRLLDEGGWAALGQVGAAMGALIGMRLITEVVSPHVFGIVALLTGLSMFGSNLLCMPLYQATQKYYAHALDTEGISRLRRVSASLLKRSVLALILLYLMAGAVWGMLGYGSYWSFICLAALVPFEAIRAFEITLLGAARRQKSYGLWTALEAWLRPILAVVFALCFGPSPEMVLVGYILATGLGIAAFRWLSMPEGIGTTQATLEGDVAELRRSLSRFALPLIPLALTTWAFSLGDRYVVGGLMGLEWVGIYAAAYALVSRPLLMLGTMIGQTLKPVYYRFVAQGEFYRASQLLRWWMTLALVLGCLAVAMIWLLSEQLAALLLAEEFRLGAKLMPWIAAGYVAQTVATIFESVLYAHGRTARIALVQGAVAVFALIAVVIGARQNGLLGVAIACPVYFGFHAILAAISVKGADT